MDGKYFLEWLDSLITVSFNPAKTDISAITDEQVKTVLNKIAEEKSKLQALLLNHVFSLTKEKQIELFLKQYHSALILLLDQASEIHKSVSNKRPVLKNLASEIVACIDELLSFIEFRFSDYLHLDERVPVTYLILAKRELKPRMDKLKRKFSVQKTDEQLKIVILNCLYSFINPGENKYPVTFSELLYIKELLNELETIGELEEQKSVYSVLDKVLIYLNFNSTEYIGYLTHHIADRINAHENISEKMDCLLFQFKEFNQIHQKSGTFLYPQQTGLNDELRNWFTQEIFYLEKKLHLAIVPIQDKAAVVKDKPPVESEKSKVLCVLSTDQMALILRAADELQILIAKSMNEVFKTIVPHLSTPYKEVLSYDSMRSKSYTAELRDKKIAIETLENLIEKIKSY